MEKLVIQGSGFSGPIPSGISLLENLTVFYYEVICSNLGNSLYACGIRLHTSILPRPY
ncbi:hypothetical protein Lalb_Chr01g0016411 [Lupinus albus]|uniref:Uncharacterized protein n=1 Tax=Lupinus albus TaxID=3870 RepID=A0A6A4R6N2_LUPAL|nr:hypothetical protein Lalb_Chr01g0016411 [Lupinus albus]